LFSVDGLTEAQRGLFIGAKAHESPILMSLPRLIDKFTNPTHK